MIIVIKGITYEEYLKNNDELIYTNVGISMLPLLREGKDLFIVRKRTQKRLNKGDVVLYRRPPDSYVLHRIIKVNKKGYTILGDNCINKEYNIKDKDIIGIMTGFIRNGKKYSTDELSYRLYTKFWLFYNPFRVVIKTYEIKLKRFVKRIIQGNKKLLLNTKKSGK